MAAALGIKARSAMVKRSGRSGDKSAQIKSYSVGPGRYSLVVSLRAVCGVNGTGCIVSNLRLLFFSSRIRPFSHLLVSSKTIKLFIIIAFRGGAVFAVWLAQPAAHLPKFWRWKIRCRKYTGETPFYYAAKFGPSFSGKFLSPTFFI